MKSVRSFLLDFPIWEYFALIMCDSVEAAMPEDCNFDFTSYHGKWITIFSSNMISYSLFHSNVIFVLFLGESNNTLSLFLYQLEFPIHPRYLNSFYYWYFILPKLKTPVVKISQSLPSRVYFNHENVHVPILITTYPVIILGECFK